MGAPSLKLEHFKYTTITVSPCSYCWGFTRQELYEGHTFNTGSKLSYCLECGRKTIV